MATLTLNSGSQVCRILSRPYGAVMQAAAALSMVPAARINLCQYWTDEQVEALRQHFEKDNKQ